MAATNPFRVSDLIAKYGWKVMPYLSNLGPLLLAEAQVLFVDHGHTNALDADDTEHGHSFEKPLDTIDYAIDLCTAGERSVILVAPGHVETLAAATIDFDVSDITCIGIGEGSNRPKVVFGNAASSVDIGANNIHLINLRFVPSITDILIGVDIETGKTGTIIEDCEFAEGDDIATDEFIVGLAVKATCTDTQVKNCLFRTGLAADGATAAIQLTGISDNVVIEKSRFIGNWGTAAIYNDSGVCTDLLIDDCTIKVADSLPGISVVATTSGIIRDVCIESTSHTVDILIVATGMSWFNNYGVVADGSAAEIIGGGEVNAQIVAHGLDHLVTLADGTTVRPASVVEDSILAKLMGSDDPATIGSYDNSKHSLEAIGDDADTIIEDLTVAVPTTPTAGSLQDIMNVGENSYSKATDSLEAIRNYIAGTTALDAINLDHLALSATADTNDPVDIAEVVDNSILAHILTDDGNVDGYDRRIHSLEAIANRQNIMAALFADVVPGNSALTKVWYLDDNISSGGDGKTPETAFKTLTLALAACTDATDDWILVYSHSGTTAGFDLTVSNVHIIGHGSEAYPWPRFKPSNDEAALTCTNGKGTIEIANCVIGGGTSYPGIHVPTGVTSSKLFIHNCVFGWDASSTCQDGIRIDSGGAAPRSMIRDNKFWYAADAGIKRDGIRITGNATRSIIKNNKFYEISEVGVNINSAGAVEIKVENNEFQLESDTAGSAVYIGNGCARCTVTGNKACYTMDGPYEEVFQDATTTTIVNEFGFNIGGGGLEKFRENCMEIIAARQYHLFNGASARTRVWYVDANSSGFDGKTPARAFTTIADALAVCSDSHEDWIFVYDYSGSTGTITLNVSSVHIIGYKGFGHNYAWPRIKPSTDVPGFTLSNGKGSIEIANFRIGGYTNKPGIQCPAGAVCGNIWIHDCGFGYDSATAGEQALEVEATGGMPRLVFEDNIIESGITEEGILLSAQCTQSIIRRNYIHAACTQAYPAIHLANGLGAVRVVDNRINGAPSGDDADGWGIEVDSTCSGNWIDGNSAGGNDATVSFNPYRDGSSNNGWGNNYASVVPTAPA